jgi:hypothetical protein
MAIPVNLYSRRSLKGDAEDVIDAITNTDQEETPVLSSIGRAKAKATFHQYQRDAFRAANDENAAIDGDDAAFAARTPTTLVGNHCQTFQDSLVVSGRADKIKKYGRDNEFEYQRAKAMLEIKRDIEKRLVSSKGAQLDVLNATAGKFAGAGAMIYSNVSHGVGGSTPAHTTGAQTAVPVVGTLRAFSIGLLSAAQEQAFNSVGRSPPVLVMSASHKTQFSAFPGLAANRWDIDGDKQGRVVGGADVFVGNFGKMIVVPHYLMGGANTVFGFNYEYMKMAYLRPYVENMLGTTGDSRKMQILIDGTLQMKAENVHIKISDLIV